MTRPTTQTGPTIDPNNITVLKVGGAMLTEPRDLDRLADHVNDLSARGRRVVIVHGGGPEISELHRRLDVPFEKRDGLRVTSDEGMDLTVMVLCGAVQNRVVAHLVGRGIEALGVNGVDLGLMRAEPAGEETWGRVGTAPEVAADRLRRLLDAGVTVVLAPVSIGPDGRAINVNADDAAHAVATALEAESLDFVSDVAGVLGTDRSVLPHIGPADLDRLVANGVVRDGMIPKLRAALTAVRLGVGRVRIGDFEAMHSGRATEITTEITTASPAGATARPA